MIAARPAARSDPRPTQVRTDAQLASALRPAVLRLARRLRQMHDENIDLSQGQLSAIGTLYRHEVLPIGELAEIERVKPPSMTRMVDKLEAAGMVVREDDPGDRRSCRVRITQAGRDLIIADRKRRDAWLAVRLRELDPAEREILRKAIAILEKVSA